MQGTCRRGRHRHTASCLSAGRYRHTTTPGNDSLGRCGGLVLGQGSTGKEARHMLR